MLHVWTIQHPQSASSGQKPGRWPRCSQSKIFTGGMLDKIAGPVLRERHHVALLVLARHGLEDEYRDHLREAGVVDGGGKRTRGYGVASGETS